jgi:predicted DNA-binding transcriptional regulator AlpA
LLDAREAAAEVRLSLPAFWKQVRQGRLPKPLYPAPRCPRWVLSELRDALLATRCLPSEAMDARRKAKIHAGEKST